MSGQQATGFSWWTSAAKARALGCTHHARLMGIVPGFFAPETGLWCPRSDLLFPLEEAVCWLWATLRQMRGEEPDFAFRLGPEINADA